MPIGDRMQKIYEAAKKLAAKRRARGQKLSQTRGHRTRYSLEESSARPPGPER